MQSSFSPIFSDVDLARDPMYDLEDRLEAARATGARVVPVNYGGQAAWVILNFADVAAIFMDDEKTPAAASYERVAMPAQGRTLLAMRGEQHRRNRSLVAGILQPSAVRRRIESQLKPLADRLIDRLAGVAQPVDLVSTFTKLYPFNVISALLDIPLEEEGRILEWVNLLFLYPHQPEAALEARRRISEFLQPMIDSRREVPGDDIISQLASVEVEGERLDDEEILSFIRLLYPAGADTTYLALGSLIRDAIVDRERYRMLVDNHETRAAFIDETLRLRPPVALQVRYTEAPLQIGDVDIPANSWLLFGISPGNRDPKEFTAPDVTELGRRNRLSTLTFGRGPHFCIGRHLAREELTIGLNVALDRLPNLRLAEDTDAPASGAVLRGVRSLPVLFDRVLPAAAST